MHNHKTWRSTPRSAAPATPRARPHRRAAAPPPASARTLPDPASTPAARASDPSRPRRDCNERRRQPPSRSPHGRKPHAQTTVPGIAHLAVFGPVGVLSSRCTTTSGRIQPIAACRRPRLGCSPRAPGLDSPMVRPSARSHRAPALLSTQRDPLMNEGRLGSGSQAPGRARSDVGRRARPSPFGPSRRGRPACAHRWGNRLNLAVQPAFPGWPVAPRGWMSNPPRLASVHLNLKLSRLSWSTVRQPISFMSRSISARRFPRALSTPA
jgi:hypothetical protein